MPNLPAAFELCGEDTCPPPKIVQPATGPKKIAIGGEKKTCPDKGCRCELFYSDDQGPDDTKEWNFTFTDNPSDYKLKDSDKVANFRFFCVKAVMKNVKYHPGDGGICGKPLTPSGEATKRFCREDNKCGTAGECCLVKLSRTDRAAKWLVAASPGVKNAEVVDEDKFYYRCMCVDADEDDK